MVDLPAKCEQCGLVWPFRGIGGGSISSLMMSGNFSNCPRCGGRSRIGDGVFKVDREGEVSVRSAPPETHRMFAQLYRTLRDNRLTPQQLAKAAEIAALRHDGTLSGDAAKAAATEVSSVLAPLFSAQALDWYALLANLLTLYIAFVTMNAGNEAQQAQLDLQRQSLVVAEQQLAATQRMESELRTLAEKKRARMDRPKRTRSDKLRP